MALLVALRGFFLACPTYKKKASFGQGVGQAILPRERQAAQQFDA